MYFGPGISVGRRGISYGDSDAQAFISATGLTGTTEVNAVNNLVANLKTYGLWSKMKAIYPFVSDTYNLVSYSEDFNSWIKSNTPVTVNAINSPTGTLTADKLVADTVNTQHSISSYTITVTAGLPYTRSVYVKKGEYSNIVLTVGGFAAYNDWKYVAFNLDTNTFTGASGSTTYGYSDAGNGWVRIWFTVTPTTTGSDTFTLKVSNNPNNASQGPTFAGDGTSGLYVWGAQFQQSATVTTYQPISTTADSRFVSQFKYNLKDPRDLDAAFRLAFNGTLSYSKQGIKGNGTNTYISTYLNPSTTLTNNNLHFSYYSRTNIKENSQDLNASNNNPATSEIFLTNYGLATNTIYFTSNAFTPNTASYIASDSLGYVIGNTTANNLRNIFKGGVKVATDTSINVTALPNINTNIGARANPIQEYSAKQFAFATIGDGLSDTEATNLYTSVQQFNQDLNRQVGVPIVSDSDAQSFLNAAQITDITQANAINTLVVGLKNASLWAKMKAIYPFVGGTATSHKWNLKDPRDLDVAYRLAFYGAWTHSSTGALPNGTNAYADTFLNMASVLTNNNNHMSFYSRTNSPGVLPANYKMEMGVTDNTTHSNQISPNYNGTNALFENGSTVVAIANANTTGMYIGSTTSSTNGKLYKNNAILGSSTTLNTYSLFSNKMYLSATNISSTNIASYYSNREKAFTTIGDGLSDSEASTLYTLVQAFQTTLSRQV